MRLIQTVVVFFATALLVSARSDASNFPDPTAGLLSDFPNLCSSSCSVFNDVMRDCGELGKNGSERAALDCLCDGSVQSIIESCGGCIVQNTADVGTSAFYSVIAHFGAAFGLECGRQINIPGVPPEVPSTLAWTGDGEEVIMTDIAALDGAATSAAAGAPTPTEAAVAGPSSAPSQAVSTSGTAALPSNTAQSEATTPEETSGAVATLSSSRTVLPQRFVAVALPLALVRF